MGKRAKVFGSAEILHLPEWHLYKNLCKGMRIRLYCPGGSLGKINEDKRGRLLVFESKE